jgi:hypothetical protein
MKTHRLFSSVVRGCAALLVATIAGSCASTPESDFTSAEQAVDALIAALRANDTEKLHVILGPAADEVLSSGDPIADQNGVATFLASYDEAHKLVANADGAMTLTVGSSEWPMPIPVVANGAHWSFDTEAGADELLSRRIGRNELDAVQVCLAVVDAEREYALEDRDGDGVQEYAEKFWSDPGKKNGLYWPTQEGEPPSPLGELAADAEDHGYKAVKSGEGPRPYRGYYFKILTSQAASAEGGEFDYVVNGQMIGGFALVAYPAEYANSGIMTFIVNHAGVVYEKDLGEMTAETARSITKFGPGAGWVKVPQDTK